MPFVPFCWRTTHRVKNRSDSRDSSGFLAPTKAAVFGRNVQLSCYKQCLKIFHNSL